MMLFQSICPFLRTATFRSTTPSTLIRTLSTRSDPSREDTFQQRYEEALSRLITPSIPRSQNNNSSRSFPSYRYSRLPIDFETGKPRRPVTGPDGKMLYPSKQRYDTGVTPEEMPYLHHYNDDEKPKPKFKSPRKRASKLLNDLKNEKVQQSMAAKPQVFGVPFRVGDAVEIQVLEDGGVDNPQNKKLDKIRGVVLGRVNRGLDTSIYLKDVVFGEHMERKIKLHSPMIKTLKVLEENFVHKGRKKIKRAKLYYLRDRKPDETRVTKW
mmetsp:Transcript_16093/g.33679  ORF Transcript_16093/g.33679 Transcript_16093/m.33679 type:complete len:268 (-) Transcript_16093:214-1017(-)